MTTLRFNEASGFQAETHFDEDLVASLSDESVCSIRVFDNWPQTTDFTDYAITIPIAFAGTPAAFVALFAAEPDLVADHRTDERLVRVQTRAKGANWRILWLDTDGNRELGVVGLSARGVAHHGLSTSHAPDYVATFTQLGDFFIGEQAPLVVSAPTGASIAEHLIELWDWAYTKIVTINDFEAMAFGATPDYVEDFKDWTTPWAEGVVLPAHSAFPQRGDGCDQIWNPNGYCVADIDAEDVFIQGYHQLKDAVVNPTFVRTDVFTHNFPGGPAPDPRPQDTERWSWVTLVAGDPGALNDEYEDDPLPISGFLGDTVTPIDRMSPPASITDLGTDVKPIEAFTHTYEGHLALRPEHRTTNDVDFGIIGPSQVFQIALTSRKWKEQPADDPLGTDEADPDYPTKWWIEITALQLSIAIPILERSRQWCDHVAIAINQNCPFATARVRLRYDLRNSDIGDAAATAEIADGQYYVVVVVHNDSEKTIISDFIDVPLEDYRFQTDFNVPQPGTILGSKGWFTDAV